MYGLQMPEVPDVQHIEVKPGNRGTSTVNIQGAVNAPKSSITGVTARAESSQDRVLSPKTVPKLVNHFEGIRRNPLSCLEGMEAVPQLHDSNDSSSQHALVDRAGLHGTSVPLKTGQSLSTISSRDFKF